LAKKDGKYWFLVVPIHFYDGVGGYLLMLSFTSDPVLLLIQFYIWFSFTSGSVFLPDF